MGGWARLSGSKGLLSNSHIPATITTAPTQHNSYIFFAKLPDRLRNKKSGKFEMTTDIATSTDQHHATQQKQSSMNMASNWGGFWGSIIGKFMSSMYH
jgi:hypothetical protein